jgi:hypothetical protein
MISSVTILGTEGEPSLSSSQLVKAMNNKKLVIACSVIFLIIVFMII